jgi:hypothetical protein
MQRTTKIAMAVGTALTLGLAGAGVYAHPEGEWGPGYGCGAGYGMGGGYGMGPGYHMGPGHGMGPGYGRGGPGYGMGPGYAGREGYGMGLPGLLHGYPGAVEERLAGLKSALGITDQQQAAWTSFADSAKKQADDRLAWFDKMRGEPGVRTAPEWLAQRDAAMKQHQADMEAVTQAVTKLYAVLTPEQRTMLDQGPVAQGRPYRGWGR